MTLTLNRPADDEVEICLLGRGSGECIMVHLLDKHWMVVDSYNRSKSQPVALWYLSEIGVDPSEVDVIVTTHFHRDHHLGVDVLHDACVNARLVTTGALGLDQFKKIRASDAVGAAVGALAGTIESAKARQRRGLPGWLRAQVGQTVWSEPEMNVRAVSPTAFAMDVSDDELGVALEQGWDAVASQLRDDNRSCVALHLDVAGVRALLCADLPGPAPFGWAAVLEDPLNTTLDSVDLVKVGHHGSDTAHEPKMWDRLVASSPVAVVAPFTPSKLPRRPDIQRLAALCGEIWQAAPSDGMWTDEDGVRMTVRGKTGFVRARRRVGEAAWRIDSLAPGTQVH